MYPNVGKLKEYIHKAEVKTDPSNFRHIFIFPIPMKIFEKIVHDQVSAFIKPILHMWLNELNVYPAGISALSFFFVCRPSNNKLLGGRPFSAHMYIPKTEKHV